MYEYYIGHSLAQKHNQKPKSRPCLRNFLQVLMPKNAISLHVECVISKVLGGEKMSVMHFIPSNGMTMAWPDLS